MRHRCEWRDAQGGVSKGAMILYGPIADVALSRPGTTPEEIQQAAPIQVKMLIDTGAYKTVIDRGIAEALGLEPIRFEEMSGISHVPEECPVFLLSVAIGLTDGSRTSTLIFTSEMIGMTTPPTPRPFNGLLGRDFLRHVRLDYDGQAGHCDIIGKLPADVPRHHGGHQGHKVKRRSQRDARRKNRK